MDRRHRRIVLARVSRSDINSRCPRLRMDRETVNVARAPVDTWA